MTEVQQHSCPSLDELESFFVNNPHLEAIRAHLGRFNPIKVMGMMDMEIRHSSILGWLMDPQETHGLGDKFLKAFLSQALRGYEGPEKPTALALSQADLSDAIVRKEWRNIDLLVLSPRNGWIFIVENKYHSAQHSNQLTRYFDEVEKCFFASSNYRSIRGIFLSLWDEVPEDPRYATITYEDVTRLLEQTALSGRISLAPEVEIFLKHYLEIILEANDMNPEREEMEALAKELYRNHRKVLDFILENGKSTAFTSACEDVFEDCWEYGEEPMVEGQTLVVNYVSGEVYGFTPKSWYVALGGQDPVWEDVSHWWGGIPVTMWVQLFPGNNGTSGRLGLYAELGPLIDHSLRSAFIDAIESAAKKSKLKNIRFSKSARNDGAKYSRFFKNNTVPVEDIHDPEQISGAIRQSLKTFKKEVEALEEVFPALLKQAQNASGKV